VRNLVTAHYGGPADKLRWYDYRRGERGKAGLAGPDRTGTSRGGPPAPQPASTRPGSTRPPGPSRPTQELRRADLLCLYTALLGNIHLFLTRSPLQIL